MNETSSNSVTIEPDESTPSTDATSCSLNMEEISTNTKTEASVATTLTIEEILKKFVEEEESYTSADYTKRFYIIRLEQETLRQEPEYASNSACNPCHYMRNRYRDILPYDYNRITLTVSEENPDGYMNASLISLPGGKTKFIAAQAPLSSTLDEWWQMISEKKVDIIIMLCKLIEMNKVKCERYWPENKDEPMIFGNFEITFLEEQRFNDDSDYVLRLLKMENVETKEVRTIRQLHYIEWPDHGCPSGENQLLNMIEKMEKLHTDKTSPILVHCSAGVGRTGTIIAVNHIRELLESNSLTDLNLFELVMSLRKQRASMVQTQDQYQFVHKCVARYARRRLNLPEPEKEVAVSEKETDSPKITKTENSSDESETEESAVPDFPNEPPAPRGPEKAPEELGSAAS